MMNMKWYVNNEKLLAGITLKNKNKMMEMNNMALHACENKAVIVQNRNKLANALNCSLDDFVCANQTHSASFYEVTMEDRGRGAKELKSAIPDTDALYTTESGIVLCAFTADCVPIFFYHEHAEIIGVIHSGWKGTTREIVPKTLLHVSESKRCSLTDFHIYIGLALSQDRFEVDEDVFIQFKALGYADSYIRYNEKTDKYHIDNQLVIKKQCEMLGIPTEQISIDRTCTYDSLEGFSYRENRQAGRHLAFIMKK